MSLFDFNNYVVKMQTQQFTKKCKLTTTIKINKSDCHMLIITRFKPRSQEAKIKPT